MDIQYFMTLYLSNLSNFYNAKALQLEIMFDIILKDTFEIYQVLSLSIYLMIKERWW